MSGSLAKIQYNRSYTKKNNNLQIIVLHCFKTHWFICRLETRFLTALPLVESLKLLKVKKICFENKLKADE